RSRGGSGRCASSFRSGSNIWEERGVRRRPSTGPPSGRILAAHVKGNLMRSVISAAALLILSVICGGASAQNTDLLLVLAADVSRSIDESEFELQRKGYAAAL